MVWKLGKKQSLSKKRKRVIKSNFGIVKSFMKSSE